MGGWIIISINKKRNFITKKIPRENIERKRNKYKEKNTEEDEKNIEGEKNMWRKKNTKRGKI